MVALENFLVQDIIEGLLNYIIIKTNYKIKFENCQKTRDGIYFGKSLVHVLVVKFKLVQFWQCELYSSTFVSKKIF